MLESPQGVHERALQSWAMLTECIFDQTGSQMVAFEILYCEPTDALKAHQLQGSGGTVLLKEGLQDL